MAKLIREDGGGHRRVRRPDGRTEQFARAPRWRIRYGLFYPDGDSTQGGGSIFDHRRRVRFQASLTPDLPGRLRASWWGESQSLVG
jgi:hypothetical protein